MGPKESTSEMKFRAIQTYLKKKKKSNKRPNQNVEKLQERQKSSEQVEGRK